MQKEEAAPVPYRLSPVRLSGRRVAWLIGALSLLKLFLAFFLELGNDEAYYWLYSQQLQWNYFDHPPLVALWIRVFTFNLQWDGWEGFLRVGSVLGSALSSYFMYRATALIHSERAGLIAAVLYHSFFYAGITAGLYILPDAPQMVFWTLSLWMLARIVSGEGEGTGWIIFGLASGLAFMSKVHGGFLWVGTFLFALFYRRHWFGRWPPYAAGLVFLLVISPFIYWNWQHRLASIDLHSGRMNLSLAGLNGHSFLIQLLSQITFNNPLNTAFIVAGLLGGTVRRARLPDVLRLYSFIALPLAGMILLASAFMPVTMPHWSGPAYVSLIPVAAVFLSERFQAPFPRLLKWSFGLFLAGILGYAALVNFFPGTYSQQRGDKWGRGDMTLDMYGWRAAARSFDSLYQRDQRFGIMPAQPFLVTSFWWGAHVEYYFGRKNGLRMLGLGRPTQVGQYLWTNPHRMTPLTDAAYCIVPSDERYRIPTAYFRSVELAQTVDIYRNGGLSRKFFIYRLRGWTRAVPAAEQAIEQ